MLTRVLALALLAAAPAAAQEPLAARVAATLKEAGPGPRFGLVVADDTGREIVAIAPDDRFMPASNTKLFPTAAAFATLPVTEPGVAASVRLDGRDVVLTGTGEARLSSAPDCVAACLATLADAVAARTRSVGAVIGDDTLFPDQRWSPGMSWNNIPGPYGTGISALTLDDNEQLLTVTPGAPGLPPTVTGTDYLTIDNRALTVAGGTTSLDYDRLPGERTLRLTGTIAAGAPPRAIRVGIDDPAHYAAWRFAALLRARGVRVDGPIAARHRPVTANDDPARRGYAPAARPPLPAPLATVPAPPLADDLTRINKESQNLHAELVLRRLGAVTGSGSIEDGQAVIAALLSHAGVPRAGYDFSDGSGMSTYNRLSPRATVTFLRWATTRPWGASWRATFPVAGVDGTLASRFKATPLAGKLFAKTGSLNATNALSGYLTAASGRTLTFSAFANDVPGDAKARDAIDRALVLIAAEN